jgi:hypothetical protein
MTFDTERFLNTPILALNQLGVLSNVGDFLKFSEENIAGLPRSVRPPEPNSSFCAGFGDGKGASPERR